MIVSLFLLEEEEEAKMWPWASSAVDGERSVFLLLLFGLAKPSFSTL